MKQIRCGTIPRLSTIQNKNQWKYFCLSITTELSNDKGQVPIHWTIAIDFSSCTLATLNHDYLNVLSLLPSLVVLQSLKTIHSKIAPRSCDIMSLLYICHVQSSLSSQLHTSCTLVHTTPLLNGVKATDTIMCQNLCTTAQCSICSNLYVVACSPLPIARAE